MAFHFKLSPEFISILSKAHSFFKEITQHLIHHYPNVFSKTKRLLKLTEPPPIVDDDPAYEALIDFINKGGDEKLENVEAFIRERNLDPEPTFKIVTGLHELIEGPPKGPAKSGNVKKYWIDFFNAQLGEDVCSQLGDQFETLFLAVMRYVAASEYGKMKNPFGVAVPEPDKKENPPDVVASKHDKKEKPNDDAASEDEKIEISFGKLFPYSDFLTSLMLSEEDANKKFLSQTIQELNGNLLTLQKDLKIDEASMKKLLDLLSNRFYMTAKLGPMKEDPSRPAWMKSAH